MAGPFKWMLVLSGIGLLYFLVAIVVAGGGHGSFVPLIIGFPWMTICTLWDSGITPFFWMLGLIQFPVYGLLIGIEKEANRYRYINAMVWLSHLILVIVLLSYSYLK